jgi:hypothetical protein
MAVQQKLMRHADIRTTFNIYGDVVADEMTTASSIGVKVTLAVQLKPGAKPALPIGQLFVWAKFVAFPLAIEMLVITRR